MLWFLTQFPELRHFTDSDFQNGGKARSPQGTPLKNYYKYALYTRLLAFPKRTKTFGLDKLILRERRIPRLRKENTRHSF